MTTAETMTLDRYGRGACPTCGRSISLTKAGLIRTHGAKSGAWPPENCVGTGQKPKES